MSTPLELLTNGLQCTASTGYNNSVTSITVNSPSSGPAIPSLTTGQTMRCYWDGELIGVSAISGTGNVNWTITRGIEGTSPLSHLSGSTIYQILAQAGLAQAVKDNGGGGTLRGTTASLPSASSASGALYFATDSPLSYQSNGTSWQAYCGGYACTPPGPTSGITGYTALTAGGTISQLGDAISLNMTGGGSGNVQSPGFYTTSTITTSSSVVEVGFGSLILANSYGIVGACIYSSASQGLVFGPGVQGSVGIWDPNVGNYYTGGGGYPQSPACRYRWRFTSTSAAYPEMSIDCGLNWFIPYNYGSFDTSGFTHRYLGVACGSNAANVVNATLIHWKVT